MWFILSGISLNNNTLIFLLINSLHTEIKCTQIALDTMATNFPLLLLSILFQNLANFSHPFLSSKPTRKEYECSFPCHSNQAHSLHIPIPRMKHPPIPSYSCS